MPEELNALLEIMQVENEFVLGNKTFFKGKLYNREVVLVFSKWGKVAAATTTVQLINTFQPDEIIFSGVAGGLQKDLNIGDVILATKLYQYDMDATPLYPSLEIPLLNKSFFSPENNLKLLAAIDEFLMNYELYFQSDAPRFNIKQPKLYQGTIVTGDQFVHTQAQQNMILKKLPDALCAEMEGGAVAQVCYEYKIPFQVLRIISDKADQSAVVDFPDFVGHIAGLYTKYILKNYLKN